VSEPDHPTSGPLRVSVVDDDEEFRDNLALLMSRAEGFLCVSRHGKAEDALRRIPDLAPDVVLMDINLPGISGIECVRRLRSLAPETQVLMLTVYEDSERIFQSLVAGASGYLLKRTPGAQILEAVRDVRAGGSPMTSHIARKVVQYFNQQRSPDSPLEALSGREREVLDRLARGRLYKEIAAELAITIDTVRKHLQSVYHKLHVHSRTEAVVKYLQKQD
jgi:DNA-binding NarL/FixJ family response regulator